jgi:hypothetical protein
MRKQPEALTPIQPSTRPGVLTKTPIINTKLFLLSVTGIWRESEASMFDAK